MYKNIRCFLSVLRFYIRSNSDVVHAVPGYFKYCNTEMNKNFSKYTQILLFNNNVDAKAYSFIFNEDI